jgi:hypothetical protein
MPELDNSRQGHPNGSVDLGDGYVLLRKREQYAKIPDDTDAQAITHYLGARRMLPRIKKWARLLLPNKQIACSAWRETTKAPEQVRMSRNVKVCSLYFNIFYVLIHYSLKLGDSFASVKYNILLDSH